MVLKLTIVSPNISVFRLNKFMKLKTFLNDNLIKAQLTKSGLRIQLS